MQEPTYKTMKDYEDELLQIIDHAWRRFSYSNLPRCDYLTEQMLTPVYKTNLKDMLDRLLNNGELTVMPTAEHNNRAYIP